MKSKFLYFIILIFAVSLICGCGKNKEAGVMKGKISEDSPGRGRYMETASDFADRLPNAIAIGKRENGKAYIMDTNQGIYEADQKGAHVKQETVKQREFLAEIEKEGIIANAAIAPDGRVAIVTYPDNTESLQYGHSILELEGNIKELDLPSDAESNGISHFWYAEDGTLYGTAAHGSIYKIDEEKNTYELLFDFGMNPGHISFKDQIMILINQKGIFFYDLEKKEWVEDTVASKFITEECKFELLVDNQYSVIAFPGEEDSFYIACEKGLFRHILGGSTMEKVIDGALCSLGDKSRRLIGMVMVNDNEFAALHYGGKLSYYIYEPDIPTVPEKTFKVYSLRENDLIRQTIHTYQAQNPNVFVKWDIGIPDNSSVTKEEAIKKLNTELMAGSGPDILVLDDLPIDSYIKKGVLKDLSPVMEQVKKNETLFHNIVDMYHSDEGTYVVPTLYKMSYIIGNEEKINKIQDLKTLADAIEELREENPEGDLIGLNSEERIIRTLAAACAPAWKNEDGTINGEEITQFLTQAKRIYQTQMGGLNEADRERQDIDFDDPFIYMNISYQMPYLSTGHTKMSIAYTEWCLWYSIFPALCKQFPDRNMIYKPFAGQSENVFLPHSLIGISAGSENGEMADKFLSISLSRQVQDAVAYGFPVNKESLNAKINKEVGIYFSAAPHWQLPEPGSLYVEWASEEEFTSLIEDITKADTPYIRGGILEDVILQIGPNALTGKKSIEDAVKEIISRAGIYMTE